MHSSLTIENMSHLHGLTHISQQVSPLLIPLSRDADAIIPDSKSSPEIHRLYSYWQQAYPEAGAIYWQTRTWAMLTWQPITIALIATYYSDFVPKLSSMKQGLNTESGVVGTFDFVEDEWTAGDQHQRQQLAAQELTKLLSNLADQLGEVCRMSPATREKLLADTVMEMLLRGLKHRVGSNRLASNKLHDTFAHELAHWQQLLALPLSRFGRLDVSHDGELFIQRRSCCMHYRRRDGSYCQGCPQNKSRT
ncbi:siderophore ferric iron reductase [Vibrio sp. 10N.261.51.F12]|uniref:siderophore ferric iron reductase n=1 Tax=Vibrio sp. 10N.261.51.F12 TaxID=3229679 RepID=UPI00355335A5